MRQSNHPEHRISRRDFLKGAAASGAGILIDPVARAAIPLVDFGKLVSRAEAAGENPFEKLPEYYDWPPEGAVEIMKGAFYKKPLRDSNKNEMLAGTQEMHNALVYVLNNSGVPETPDEVKHLLFGKPKGSFFLNEPDGKFYEFAAGERGVYHVTVDDSGNKRLQRVLILRDLAFGRIQLDEKGEKYFELPEEAEAVLKNRIMFGDGGSDSPTFDKMKKHLRVIGKNNCYREEVTNPKTDFALKTLNRDLTEGIIPEGVPWMATSDHINGQNIPEGTKNFLIRQYGQDWEQKIGLPVSDPYWMYLNIGDEYGWVMCQVFERGSITFNPQNEDKWKYEGGLAGNLFTAALSKGNENPNARPWNPDFLLPFTKEIDSTSYNRNGKDYFVKSRVTDSVSYKVTMVNELKQELGRLISQDGERHGFTSAELVLLGSEDEVPEGLNISPTWIARDPDPAKDYIMYFSYHKYNNKVLVYAIPSTEISLEDQLLSDNINWTITHKLLYASFLGGKYVEPPQDLPEEYKNLRRQLPLQITSK